MTFPTTLAHTPTILFMFGVAQKEGYNKTTQKVSKNICLAFLQSRQFICTKDYYHAGSLDEWFLLDISFSPDLTFYQLWSLDVLKMFKLGKVSIIHLELIGKLDLERLTVNYLIILMLVFCIFCCNFFSPSSFAEKFEYIRSWTPNTLLSWDSVCALKFFCWHITDSSPGPGFILVFRQNLKAPIIQQQIRQFWYTSAIFQKKIYAISRIIKISLITKIFLCKHAFFSSIWLLPTMGNQNFCRKYWVFWEKSGKNLNVS